MRLAPQPTDLVFMHSRGLLPDATTNDGRIALPRDARVHFAFGPDGAVRSLAVELADRDIILEASPEGRTCRVSRHEDDLAVRSHASLASAGTTRGGNVLTLRADLANAQAHLETWRQVEADWPLADGYARPPDANDLQRDTNACFNYLVVKRPSLLFAPGQQESLTSGLHAVGARVEAVNTAAARALRHLLRGPHDDADLVDFLRSCADHPTSEMRDLGASVRDLLVLALFDGVEGPHLARTLAKTNPSEPWVRSAITFVSLYEAAAREKREWSVVRGEELVSRGAMSRLVALASSESVQNEVINAAAYRGAGCADPLWKTIDRVWSRSTSESP